MNEGRAVKTGQTLALRQAARRGRLGGALLAADEQPAQLGVDRQHEQAELELLLADQGRERHHAVFGESRHGVGSSSGFYVLLQNLI